MKRTQRTRLQMTGWLLASGLALLGNLLTATHGHAKLAQGGNCIGCHNEKQASATISLAVNGAALSLTATPTQAWNHEASISVAPGALFEIDFIASGVNRPTAANVAIVFAPGSTWATNGGTLPSVANTGTGLVNNLANWNPVWDGNHALMVGWNEPVRAPRGGEPVGLEGNLYTKNWAGTSWDAGNSDAMEDGGLVTPNDRDQVPDRTGSDVRLQAPTSGGPYVLYLAGIGRGSAGGKGYAATRLTITLSGSDSSPPVAGTVAVAPRSGNFVPGTFTITTPFTEPDSIVTSCEYTLNGTTWVAGSAPTGSQPNFTCTATPPAQSNGSALTINMRATSTGGTGTATEITPNQVVDTVAPTTTSNAPAGWQAADVNVTLTPTDGGSGVAGTQYCVDTANSCVPSISGTSVSVTQTAGTSGTQYVRFRSTDNLGAVETTKSATVQIDKAVPTDGSLSVTPGNAQNSLSWTAAADVGSGLRTANTYDLRFLAGGTAPTCTPLTGTSIFTGTGLSYDHTGLTNGQQYSYRVCAYDNVNNVSIGSFSSGTPTAVNNPPANPPSVSLTQFKDDGVTGVPRGKFTNAASPVFKGQVTDPEGDTVQLEVEIRPIGGSFTNTPNCTSAAPAASGSTCEATCGPLADGRYMWQGRGRDSSGATSAWVQY